jgi:hypothetical protein
MSQNRQNQIDYTMRNQIRAGRTIFADFVQRRQLVQEGRLLGQNAYLPDLDASIVSLIDDGRVNTTPEELANYLAQVAQAPVGPTATVPDAPTGLSAVGGDQQLTIFFTQGSDGGSPITNYEYINLDASGAAYEPFSPPQTTSPVVITGIPNGYTSRIQLRAVNAVGPSADSEIVTGTPSTVPDAPVSLSVTTGNGQVTVAFTAGFNGGSVITNYKYSTNNGDSYTAFSPVDTVTPVTITGLANGTTYQIKLRAVNANGDGAESDAVSATPSTIPSAPTSLSAAAGNAQVTINFTAGADGGSAITNYKYSINNGTSYTAFSPADTASPVTITGLTNGTTYQIKLRAVNANGDGAQSATVSATPTAPATVPNPPTALSGVAGDGAIYVLFTAGATGGSTITNYEYSIDGGTTFTAFSPAQTMSPVEISGPTPALQNGTAYTVLLKAVNAIGSSIASSSITVTPATNTLSATGRLIRLEAGNPMSYPGSGTTWTNLDSGGSYSATLSNAPTFASTYFTFNGTNQIAEIAAAVGINPTVGSAYTVQLWARVNTASPNFASGDGLITKQYGSPSYDGYCLGLNTNTSLYLKMNGSSVDGTYGSSTGAYTNAWALYTIVVRFGGGSGSPSYVYVSTKRVVSGNNNESGIPSQAPLQFPRGLQDTGANFCPADVGAMYLYNTALSQADIIRNYDATKTAYGL